MVDQQANLAVSTVFGISAPAASGVTLTLLPGTGARFTQAPPFPVTIWATGTLPDPTTAEIARVTARTGDVLTIVRAQEGTTARTITVGDNIAATITKKYFDDTERLNATVLDVSPASGRSLTTGLLPERAAVTMPVITTSATAPSGVISGRNDSWVQVPAGLNNGNPLLGNVNTSKFTFLGGRYMEAGSSFPIRDGARLVPQPKSPQGYGGGTIEWISDAPVFVFQQIMAEAGWIRLMVDNVEVYRCGDTIRTGTAQAGTANTITLDTGSSTVNSQYATRWVRITGGTGVGQSKQIGSYVGSTRVATILGTWTTPPDATSTFDIARGRRDNTYAGQAYTMLDWQGERRIRRYRLEAGNTTIMGVYVGAADTVAPAQPTAGMPAFIEGDSFAAGTGADGVLSLAYTLCARMGWDIQNYSIGGTGVLNGSSVGLNVQDRTLPPVNAWWIGGGRGSTAGTFTVAQGALSVVVPYNATVAAVQALFDTAAAGAWFIAGDSAGNFYALGQGSNAAVTTPMTIDATAQTGGRPFIQQYLGDIAPNVPMDPQGGLVPFNLVLMTGHNDTVNTSAAYTLPVQLAAYTSLLTAWNRRWPQARIWVVGNMYVPGGSMLSDVTDTNAQILAATTAALPLIKGTVPFIDTVTVPWFTGTGAVGSQTGVGNSDICTELDRVHPTVHGHAVYGYRISQNLIQILTRAINI
jgi:hypothetical protein